MSETKLKIFVDCHCFDTEYQGTQTFVKELYNALYQQFPELDIYFGAYNADNLYRSFPFLNASSILHYKKVTPSFYRLLFDIPAFIKHHQINFAHFQNIAPHTITPCKYIVTLHDVLFNDFRQDFPVTYRYSRNFLFKKSIKQAHIKTTVSNYSLERINFYYKIPANQISILSNAANESANSVFKTKEEAENYIKEKYGIENFILYVSRVEPRKNQELLLDKYLQLELQKKGMALVFIGKESIKVPSFLKKISQLHQKQKNRIYWLEQVNPVDLYAFYASCRLFVYPSKAEGFGIPPLEAAVYKAPVLCSSTSAMRDFWFFEPYTFDPSNEKEFEEKLIQIIDNPPTPDILNKIAAKVKERYTWVTSAEKLYQLIQQNVMT